VRHFEFGDTLTDADNLPKPICGCARTIAAAVEQLLLTHAHAAIVWSFAARVESGRERNVRQ
jgi:hypothetical protein